MRVRVCAEPHEVVVMRVGRTVYSLIMGIAAVFNTIVCATLLTEERWLTAAGAGVGSCRVRVCGVSADGGVVTSRWCQLVRLATVTMTVMYVVSISALVLHGEYPLALLGLGMACLGTYLIDIQMEKAESHDTRGS